MDKSLIARIPVPRRLLSSLLAGCLVPILATAADHDGDGYDDLWQALHGVEVSSFPIDGDFDGDGETNAEESEAGTDPRNPEDRLKVEELMLSETGGTLSFTTVAGKRYRVFSSDSPSGTWTGIGAFETGTGSLVSSSFTMASADRMFYRVHVDDQDSDSDGASDWAEGITGTNPDLANSPNNASGGAANDGDTLRSVLSLSFEATSPDGVEFPVTDARVVLSRTFGNMPLFLPLALAGPVDPKSGSASPSDYLLTGSTGESLILPANQSSLEVTVTPVTDSLVEVPETLRFLASIPGLPGSLSQLSAEVRITDRTNAVENQRLFVAYLAPIDGVTSSASGIVTALVEGDNNRALVNLSFSNLSSTQNTAYIRVGADLEVARIPNGQITAHPWNIRAAQILSTDQATLNALEAGSLFVTVSSASFPGGEIRGTLQAAEGSISDPPPPIDPPAYPSDEFPNLAVGGTANNLPLDRDIARFLTQASFGPTPESIGEVRTFIANAGDDALAGYAAWIDDQIGNAPNPSLRLLVEAADLEEFLLRGNKPINYNNDPQFGGNSKQFNNSTRNWDASSIHQNNHPFDQNRRREWWTLVLNTRAQLRHRMAFALSEILVISENDATVNAYHYGAANYWDMLAANAFGPYRTVLEQVTYSPMMGVYLSHLKNQKLSGSIAPDENYAREIMQLFSIGLVQRHLDGSLKLDPVDILPIPTYDQGDITEMARVMTGMSFSKYHGSVSGTPTYPNTSTQAIGSVLNNSTFTRGNGHLYWQASWINPMKMFSAYHDFNGYTSYTGLPLPQGVPSASKILFRDKPGQKVIPVRSASDANGNADVTDALNALAGNPAAGSWDGHPTTPVFISRLLIQRFTSSNPSRGYLYRVATRFRDTKGDLGEVIKAILLDYEARSLPANGGSTPADGAGYGKPKEPLLHFTALLRGLGCQSSAPLSHLNTMTVPFTSTQSPVTTPYPTSELNKFPSGSTRFRFFDTDASLTQSPLRAPSVFNWFLPDYVFPGALGEAGLVAPEFQVATESNVVNVVNSHLSLVFTGTPPTVYRPDQLGVGVRYGRGVDNFFNLSIYQASGGNQLSVPNYGRPYDASTNPQGRGYFLEAQFDPDGIVQADPLVREVPDSINDQLDNLNPDYLPLENLYTSTYEASLADQYGGIGNVPVAPGSTQKEIAHDAAAEVVVDYFDALFTAGYLKARFGGTGGENPRQAILESLSSGFMGNRTLHTDHASYRATIVQRIKNSAYLVSTSPQALMLK
ncbi:MAG: DUF1800 family protein [Verrucomicrobiae bacterium]|nr:DUF1800 family protein [Verrucomicrobiae bacterium]